MKKSLSYHHSFVASGPTGTRHYLTHQNLVPLAREPFKPDRGPLIFSTTLRTNNLPLMNCLVEKTKKPYTIVFWKMTSFFTRSSVHFFGWHTFRIRTTRIQKQSSLSPRFNAYLLFLINCNIISTAMISFHISKHPYAIIPYHNPHIHSKNLKVT